MSSVFEIAEAVRAAQAPSEVRTKIVAIDGHGGSGKSTLAEALAAELDGAPILHTDDFASWENPLGWWPRLVEEALEPLACGEAARFAATDWEGAGREEQREIRPTEIVVLEGVSATREAFRPYLAYAIWLDTPREVCLRRGLERDGEDALARWQAWFAEEDEYVARERPREYADLVVPGEAEPLGER